MLRLLLVGLAVVGLTSAHFILEWPPTAGFDDDAEPNYPCGGQTVVVNGSSPQIPVDQFAVSIQNVHPTGEWLFRATTDTQPPYNFTTVVPIVNTTGIGLFCLTDISVPSSFANKSGVLQVIDNSPDGILYQCAPVNFISGSNTTAGPTCSNATGFSATWTNMNLQGFNSSNTSMSASTSTSKAGAAMATSFSGLVGGIGMIALGVGMVL